VCDNRSSALKAMLEEMLATLHTLERVHCCSLAVGRTVESGSSVLVNASRLCQLQSRVPATKERLRERACARDRVLPVI